MTVHIPVLPNEVLTELDPQPGSIFVDGTLGGGGHTQLVLDRIGESGRVFGFDRDPAAVAATDQRISDKRLTSIVGNYSDIPEELAARDVAKVDSILLDLGLSSDQLADRDRGFSYQSEGPLDLRFNPLEGEPASRLVNRLSERHLADLIYEFGEERLSRRIARKIVSVRHENKIESSQQLAKIIRSCVPRSKNHSIDPATRTFQALRIAVNQELKWLHVAMERLPGLLATGGRIGVISFHSLEDRIVKRAFADNTGLKVVTRKPLQASTDELETNPRSRSAKLRIAERIG